MVDIYHDVYTDVYGTLSAPAAGGVFSLDGTNAPRLIVEVAWGGNATIDPQAGFFNLNADLLDGPAVLGSLGWVDIATDVKSVSIRRGGQGEIEQATPGTWTVVLDNASGAYDPTNTTGPYYGQIDVGVPITIKAEWDGVTYGRCRGFIDDILPDAGANPTVTLTCSDALAWLGRAHLPTSTPVFGGDLTGTRINRILDLAGWPTSMRHLEAGISTCQPAVYGDWALSLLQDVVATELGTLFGGKDGTVVFFGRLRQYTNARSQTVRALLTDTGTDIDMVSLTVGLSRATIFNEARITRDGGTEQVATDATSRAKYGPQTYPGTAGKQLPTDQDAASLASWLVGRYKTSGLRVTEVTVQAATLGMWNTLLQLDILDRIRVVRDYGPVTIDQQVLIEGYEESISKDAWDFTISTRQVDNFKPFILNSSLLGTGMLA